MVVSIDPSPLSRNSLLISRDVSGDIEAHAPDKDGKAA